MPNSSLTHRQRKKKERQRQAKYRRARIRSFLFTVGPDRLTGGRIAQRHLAQDVVVREIEVVCPGWPRAFDGLRIGHISDFHLGQLMPVERALEIVGQLAELEVDLVACTGDVVDLHHHDAPPVLDALAAIDAPFGSMLVLGNHDELHCCDTISRMAESAGLVLLQDTAAEVNHNGGHLLVAGIRWAKSATACARHVDRTCGDGAHLLLAHNPKAFGRAADLRVPLTLSGHTHGGQVAMKDRPTANLALTHRHSAGLYERGGSRLFVTAGVGAWFPLRVNCPAEVAVLTVRHDPAAAGAGEP
ncbi:MAG: metallophosphoesterase [Planctomycetota bacterium]|jgi:predicted MPP superfamily phosphohydrolase